jgi:hypothetical protein
VSRVISVLTEAGENFIARSIIIYIRIQVFSAYRVNTHKMGGACRAQGRSDNYNEVAVATSGDIRRTGRHKR